MNLLMIAPLYDNKGTVRYFLGCQIDVSPLIEAGRGLDSFGRLLSRDRADSRFGGRNERKPAEILQDLGAMFDDDEMSSMKNTANRYAQDPGRSTPPSAGRGSQRGGRRILGMDDDRALWPHPSLGPSGRLPGVYQNVSLAIAVIPQSISLRDLVSSRKTLPFTSHHLHLSRFTHSWSSADKVPRQSRRSGPCPRRHHGRSRPWHLGHRQNHVDIESSH